MATPDVFRASTVKAGLFVQNLQAAAASSNVALDSVASNEAGAPESIAQVVEASGKQSKRVLKAILDGATAYEAAHGVKAPADVLEHAMHQAFATLDSTREQYALDSATSTDSDNESLQANRAIVSIIATLGEAVPFANYLPADIGSNEAKLIITSHVAANAYGGYADQEIMDGASSGKTYMSSERAHTLTNTAGALAGALTTKQTDGDTCDQAAGTLLLIRGRTKLYINGQFAAKEVDSSGTGASTMSGKITISGVEYVIGGTVNTDTGVAALTTTPALPGTNKAVLEGYIDYERNAANTPSIITRADKFSLYANPWRVTTFQSIDARTQMANELGLDPYAESVYSIHSQFANERHRTALVKLKRIAANSSYTFDFAWPTQGLAKTPAEIIQGLSAVLGEASQKMAGDTMNHGITHLYVGRKFKALLMGMPSSLFTPTGIETPGIHRVGRLFGMFEVYFTPHTVTETATGSQILCIGRATDAARNPIVMGDAVPPTMMPLAVGADLRTGSGFYARTFTDLNPHAPSAMGAALIDVTNLF